MVTKARVSLWGRTVGAVIWNEERQRAEFQYDAAFCRSGLDVAPIMMPLSQAGDGATIFSFGDVRDDLKDELRVLLKGARTSGYATFSSHARPVGQFVRLYGTRNTLHVDYVMRTVTVDASATLPSAIGRLVPAFVQASRLLKEGSRNVVRFAKNDFHYFAGLGTLAGLFYDCIVTDGPVPIPYRDILRVARVMDEIFRQVWPDARARAGGAEGRAS